VIDSQTLTPIAGATVRFGDAFSATTDSTGWYRIDLGCPTSVQAINAVITKDGYRTYERVVADYGYPIRVSRFDFSLGR
jgi:phosphatidate phosphatase APP1